MTARAREFRMAWAAGVMGFGGLFAQQLLLRELLIVFAGNELTIGLILSCWLASEAAGALWARRARISGASASDAADAPALRRFMGAALFFSLSLVPAIYAVRLIKPALGISVGTVVGLGSAATASLIVLAPVGVAHGALFTLGCAACFRRPEDCGTDGFRTPATHVYVLETVGTLLAGLLWTAALVRWGNAFQVAAGIALLNAATVLFLAGRLGRKRVRWRIAGAVLAVASVLAGVAGGADFLQRRSIEALWQRQNVLHYENTVHGNVAITENLGQYAFFTDGTPSFMIPVPDTGLVEPLVHIPMAAHPRPSWILLIGGGVGGFAEAILKHPSVARVDYLERDARLLHLQRELASAAEAEALDDPRVELHAADARAWLAGGGRRYDVVISRQHAPDNLHGSLFFSEEFFRLAADNLEDGGMLVLGFPGLVGHLDEPLRHLAAGVHGSLERTFPVVRAFPGDAHSFLIASRDAAVAGFDVDGFAQRLRERGLLDAAMLPWHVEQRLHPRWHAWFEEFAAGGTKRATSDFHPRALFLGVAHWSSLNAPGTARVLMGAFRLNPALLGLAVPAALLAAGAVLNRFSPGRQTRAIPAVMATGFTAMVVNLSLMFAFQIVAGRLFGWLGLLSAAFIAGLGIGALHSSWRIGRAADAGGFARKLLVQTDIAVLLFGSLLLALLPWAAPRIAAWLPSALVRILFFPLLLAAGAVCGAQFPAACAALALAANGRRNARRSAADPSGSGLVYAADLLGGCAGGILGGIALLPLLGLSGTGATIGLLKSATALMLALAPKSVASEEHP